MPLVIYLRLNVRHLGWNILATRLGISAPIGRNVIGTIEAFVPIVMWAAVEIRIPKVAFVPEVALVAVFVPAVALTAIMAPTIVLGTSLVLIAVVSAISVVLFSVPGEGSSGHH